MLFHQKGNDRFDQRQKCDGTSLSLSSIWQVGDTTNIALMALNESLQICRWIILTWTNSSMNTSPPRRTYLCGGGGNNGSRTLSLEAAARNGNDSILASISHWRRCDLFVKSRGSLSSRGSLIFTSHLHQKRSAAYDSTEKPIGCQMMSRREDSSRYSLDWYCLCA